MEFAISIVVGFISATVLIVQDFRTRMLSILPLILLGVGGIYYKFLLGGWDALIDTLPNIFMVLVILTGLWFWFRGIQRRQLWDELIGVGDICMFFILAFWLEPFPFLIVFNVSILLGLLIGLLLVEWDKNIPLAGIMGAALIIEKAIDLLVSEPTYLMI